MPRVVPDFKNLGFPPIVASHLCSLGRATGLLLVSGATGSGKSTTLASLLKEFLSKEGGYAFTIENPIEMPLDGIYRCPSGDFGLCKQTSAPGGQWEEGLKSALRSAPRYILLGEIRTPDVACLALQAAMSGHLIFSTIHANSVPDAVNALVKYAGSGGAQVYVRINNWETEMTNDDLEAVVWEGLDGVTLAKTGHPDDVKRLDWKLEELERRRGIPVGTVKISMLLETAKGIMNAYECCMASSRNVNAIFGAVDYCRDMRVKLTSEAVEQMWGRAKMAIAARAAGIVAIDAPFVAYQDIPAFERNVMEGKQMGYEGRMIIHPSQVEPSNRLYAPDPADVEWANGVVKVFEEEGLAKGKAAVSYLGKMVDTPVYLNAKDILAAQAEIDAKVKK